MPLVNTFKVGADPEFVIVDSGHMQRSPHPNRFSPWGLDHDRWVVEPHPKPDLSVREIIKNLRVSMNDFALVAPEGKWVAGAQLTAPERTITLGGHVHIDQPMYNTRQAAALDLFTQHLEALDVLPSEQCRQRRESREGYGRLNDFRVDKGHFEYRSLCSWLFSQRVAKICLTGAKLLVAHPEAAVESLGEVRRTSVPRLKTLFEQFKNLDDDAAWLVNGGLFEKKLNVKPDRDLRDVWKVEPVAETPHWKAQAVAAAEDGNVLPLVTAIGPNFHMGTLRVANTEGFLVPSRIERVSRRGVRHRFRLLDTQVWNLFTVNFLGDFLENRTDTLLRAFQGRMFCVDGLLFKYVGPTEGPDPAEF